MNRAVVVGLGNIGMLYDLEIQRPHPSTHVYAYEMSSDYQLVCCIDPDIQKGCLLKSVFPNTQYYSTIEEAIDAGVLDSIDVVSVCTPPETHLDIILYLIDNKVGSIIFCEKPVVNSAEDAKKLKEAIRKSGVTVIPNMSRRWNNGVRKVTSDLKYGKYGKVEKISVRYTRGIFNTGSHLFDLLKMWTGNPIVKVFSLSETCTSSYPEKSISFWFEQQDGVTGYAEAVDDREYYLFDIDLFCSNGKIEMRNSGDDIIYSVRSPHHLFQGFQELVIDKTERGILNDTCIKNAIDNIARVLADMEQPKCLMDDAIYTIYVAEAIEKSYSVKAFVEVCQGE